MPIFLNEYICIPITNVSLCGISTGKYWQKVAEERKKKPKSIMLADKNAPNEEVWRQVSALNNFSMAFGIYFFHPPPFSFCLVPLTFHLCIFFPDSFYIKFFKIKFFVNF